MSVSPLRPLTREAPLWRGGSIAPGSWTLSLTAAQAGEVLDAVGVAEKRLAGRDLVMDRTVSRSDFPLLTLAPVLAKLADHVAHGRGFGVLRGLPVDQLSEQQCVLVLRGLTAYLGPVATQSRDGQLIRHVRATGRSLGGAAIRGHQTAERLWFHTDGADAAVLLCRNNSASGGLSRLAAAGTVHNEMLRRSASAVASLYEPVHFHMAGGNAPGLPATFISPVFSRHRGKFSVRYVRHTLLETPAVTGVPLPAEVLEAFDLLEEVASESSVDMVLEPGDLQVVNNHTVLHSRTAYVDPPPPAEPRHLLRSWITFASYAGRREAAVDEYLRYGWLTDSQQRELAATWCPPQDPAAGAAR